MEGRERLSGGGEGKAKTFACEGIEGSCFLVGKACSDIHARISLSGYGEADLFNVARG